MSGYDEEYGNRAVRNMKDEEIATGEMGQEQNQYGENLAIKNMNEEKVAVGTAPTRQVYKSPEDNRDVGVGSKQKENPTEERGYSSSISVTGSDAAGGSGAHRNNHQGSTKDASIIMPSINSDLLILSITSTMVFLQAITSCANTESCGYAVTHRDKSLILYAVAVGLVSLIICASILILTRFTTLPNRTRFYLSMFLLLWWTAAAALLTFAGPYEFGTVSNGYFCTWGSFIICAYMVHSEVEPLKKAMDNVSHEVVHSSIKTRQIYFMMVSAFVVLLSSISPCTAKCDGTAALSLAVGGVSILLGMILRFFRQHMAPHQSKVAIVLVIIWGVTTAVVTFAGPFRAVGNGYFGCYAALIFSSLYLKTNQH